jgi:hypothetical protein
MAIARGHLIIVNPPYTIEEHSLDEIYTLRDAPFLKNYPVYNYMIPDKFDLDFSDQGNLVYITAEDKNMHVDKNSVILVYRSGYPAVSSFYDVYNTEFKYEDMLIDVTGAFADYVSVALGSMLLIFRQYEIPIMVIEDTFYDFEFNITYTNDPELRYHYIQKSKVKISNYPEEIKVNDSSINESNFLTSKVVYEDSHK